MQNRLSPEEYIRSLYLYLVFEHNDMERASKNAELANKTNQFIFGYKRYIQIEIEKHVLSADYMVKSISLADKLSDRGLVGVCIEKKDKNIVLRK